ncbi:MAG: phosphoglycerate dehydrogenase [Candidatus Omnitrophota bacterium]|nr:phosphoglycerate dehydrogenase [Candidatus Omnitrophota bacterium]
MAITKILISDPLAEEGIKILEKEKGFKVDVKPKLPPDELKELIKDYDALIIRSATKVTAAIISKAEKLKIVGRAGVGLDNVDINAASKKGIIVMNAPAGNTISTAEHTMSLILALSRNIAQANISIREGKWERKKFMGSELYNKTLGVIGLGRIGAEVAKRALSFKMKVLAYDPYFSEEKSKKLEVELTDFKTLLKQADYITLHTPMTGETRHLIGKEEFRLMKQGARIINCARGGIIDEEALNEALESSRIAGAAIDVYEKEPPTDNPLIKRPNVIATPHLGASTEEAQVNVAIDIAESVRDAILDKGIRNAVNAPSIDPEMLKNMRPYLRLAEKIGLLQAQLTNDRIRRVKIKYIGDVTEYDIAPITMALVKGLLSPILQETINYMNALLIAKNRGIEIMESKTTEIMDFANAIAVTIETGKGKNLVMGSLFTKTDPRIIRINNFYVDLVPEGHLLYISNKDMPGVIGDIGTILGENNVNIAGMTFGRIKAGGDAITVLNIDNAPGQEVAEKLCKTKNINDVKIMKL